MTYYIWDEPHCRVKAFPRKKEFFEFDKFHKNSQPTSPRKQLYYDYCRQKEYDRTISKYLNQHRFKEQWTSSDCLVNFFFKDTLYGIYEKFNNDIKKNPSDNNPKPFHFWTVPFLMVLIEPTLPQAKTNFNFEFPPCVLGV